VAKRSGLGSLLLVDGYNLSGDISAIDEIGGGNDPLDVTGINKSAHERIGGVRDGRLACKTYFNPSANQSFDRFTNLPTTDVIATYCTAQSLGSSAASVVAKQMNYDGTRGDDGSFTFKVDGKANGYGVEWGELLTAGIATFGGASAGSSLDYGASVGTTNFGLQAWLHCFAFTGTSATVTIQSSTDDGAGDAFAAVTGGAFTAMTAVGAQRIETGRTAAVERYLRVNVTGTFSLFWFTCQVTRNLTSVAF
jgi:hypothetical protein